jgi:hypothetical protein
MPTIIVDLARDIAVHCRTAERTQERAVAGVTAGLIGLGEEVTFEGVHFGIRQRLTARITQFDRPRCFTDEMLKGGLPVAAARPRVRDKGFRYGDERYAYLDFAAGPARQTGRQVFLEAHMRRFLEERNAKLKQIAEA